MAAIIKQRLVVIKCSNPPKDLEPITCTPIESMTKDFPVSMIWSYSNTENLSKNDFMPSDYLQSTLSDILNYFPVLAGHPTEDEKGNITMHFTNDGVQFTEAECLNQSLDYFLPRTSSDEGFDYEHINKSDLEVRMTSVPIHHVYQYK